MAAKTLEQFYKEYRSGCNPITGEPNLFKDLTDEHVWNAAIKSVVENGSSHNSARFTCAMHNPGQRCIVERSNGMCGRNACTFARQP